MTNKQTFGDGTFTFDVEILWELSVDIDAETVPFDMYKHILTEDCWSISPMELLDVYNGWMLSGHLYRTHKADMSHPILITPDGWICDGMHRLLNAHMNNETEITIKQFDEWSEMIPAIIKAPAL
jgi:hypothetical protein